MSKHAKIPARPQPVMNSAAITSAISGLVSLVVTLGILPQTVGLQIDSAVGATVSAVSLVLSTVPVVVHAVQARGKVTPTSSPQANDGTPLVPAGSAAASSDAAVALAEAERIAPSTDAPAPANAAA